MTDPRPGPRHANQTRRLRLATTSARHSDQVTPGPRAVTRLTPVGWLLTLTLLSTTVAVGPWVFTQAVAAGTAYSVSTVPRRDVALVLGAGVLPNGTPTEYLRARLDLGYDLFQAGKVRAILVSGDNGEKHYNEPDVMREYLIRKGVPPKKVVADYAGFDTYASCVRAEKIFGTTSLTVVTQSYHLPRALTICRQLGLDAVGVGDDSVRGISTDTWRAGQVREVLADWKMVWDLTSRRQPLLGPRETSLDEALA